MSSPDFARARVGAVLSGKWRLDKLLGTGGMASVYAATHARNRLRAAIKVLHADVGRDPALRERFLREGYAANIIKHPGIVRVFDDSADEEQVYLVMELLEGKTLKDAWNECKRIMSVEETGRVISKVLDILGAAHRAGITHRDIKPDNVFLTDEGGVKLVDFGIAGVRELRADREHVTTTGTTLGTPAFMSPEQALGRWAEVDARSDLFSVGATAWVLLTGVLPHDAKGVSELLIAAATRHVRPIQSVAPGVPPALARVIDRSLEFEREARFAEADEMKKAWDAAVVEAMRSPTMVMPALDHDPGDETQRLDPRETSWGVPPSSAMPGGLAGLGGSPRETVTQARTVPIPQQPPAFMGRSPQLSEPDVRANGAVISGFATPVGVAISAGPSIGRPSFPEGPVSGEPATRRAVPARSLVPWIAGGAIALAGLLALGFFLFVHGSRSDPESARSDPSTTTPSSASSVLVSHDGNGVAAPTIAPSAARPSVTPSSEPPTTPSSAPAPSTSAPTALPMRTVPPPPRSCPPVPDGYDRMRDKPKFRCCGQPC